MNGNTLQDDAAKKLTRLERGQTLTVKGATYSTVQAFYRAAKQLKMRLTIKTLTGQIIVQRIA